MNTAEIKVKNSIEFNVNYTIEKLTAELEKYQRIKKILEDVNRQLENTILDTKRDYYENSGKGGSATKEVILDLMKDGKRRTVADMTEEILPSGSARQKRLLRNRISATLCFLIAKGVLRREENKDGKFVFWIRTSAKVKKGIRRRRKSSRKPVVKVPMVHWKDVISKAIKDTEKPMSIDEIVEHAFKGKHNNTKKILKARGSVMTTYYVKEGFLKARTDADRIRYSLANE